MQENGDDDDDDEEEEEKEEEEEEEEEEDVDALRMFDPTTTCFSSTAAIPSKLLSAIAKCYDSRLNVCRTCFFNSLDGKSYNERPTLSSKAEHSSMCERGHYWQSIRAIPQCRMCMSYGSYVAIPPIPTHMRSHHHLNSPFKLCNNPTHDYCFERSQKVNPWFPHTVEEMVIWTVERETGEWREGGEGREGGRQIEKEGGRKGGREREGGKEGEKERERWREGGREGGREGEGEMEGGREEEGREEE